MAVHGGRCAPRPYSCVAIALLISSRHGSDVDSRDCQRLNSGLVQFNQVFPAALVCLRCHPLSARALRGEGDALHSQRQRIRASCSVTGSTVGVRPIPLI